MFTACLNTYFNISKAENAKFRNIISQGSHSDILMTGGGPYFIPKKSQIQNLLIQKNPIPTVNNSTYVIVDLS